MKKQCNRSVVLSPTSWSVPGFARVVPPPLPLPVLHPRPYINLIYSAQRNKKHKSKSQHLDW